MKLIQSIYRLFVNLKQRTSRLFCLIIACLATALGLNPSVNADNLRVATNGSCAGDGSGWNSDAFRYLQDALDAAALGDQIWVRAGTYFVDQSCANEEGSGFRTETFQLVKDVFLLGGFNGTELDASERDAVANVTILSGIVYHGDPAGVCGAPGAISCFKPHEGSPGCDNSNCCQDVCAFDPICCLFGEDNGWDQTCVDIALTLCGEAYHVVTAGTEIDDPEKTVIDGFEIRDGWATDTGPLQNQGGGMLINGEPSVVRCTFKQNTASILGGAMSIRGIQPWIINCIFKDNPGDPANPGDQQVFPNNGGGLASVLDLADPILTNCLFVGNEATFDGGGIFVEAGTCLQQTCGQITLINCTFVSNTANLAGTGWSGGGLYAGLSAVTVQVDNSIFWDNSPDQIDGVPATVFDIDYSDCAGGCPGGGTGNINVIPMFVDAPIGDYRLLIASLCIDAGNTNESIIPCDFFNLDNDIFDCTFEADEATPDLDLNNRVLDGDQIDGDRVDMGAYEFIHPDICPWDLNDDCMVGAFELLALLAAWGSDPGGPPDFDGNGIVGASDLLILLANWGACPQCSFEPPSLQDELDDACLTPAHWADFLDKMETGSSAQQQNYICWLTHYFEDCTRCICIGASDCPGPDPFI